MSRYSLKKILTYAYKKTYEYIKIFIVFTVRIKNWEQPKCSSIKKLFSNKKIYEISAFVTTWMNLEGITQSGTT